MDENHDDDDTPDGPDPALVEAVEEIPDADPSSITQYSDGRGNFVINSERSDQDVEAIETALNDAGYELDGGLSVPGMVQQNFRPSGGGED